MPRSTLADMTPKQFSQFSQSQVDALPRKAVNRLNTRQRRALGLSATPARPSTKRKLNVDASTALFRRVIDAPDVSDQTLDHSKAEMTPEFTSLINPVIVEQDGW